MPDLGVHDVVSAVAGLSSLVLAAMVLTQRQPGRVQWSFALGMVGFAVEALGAYWLVATTELPEDRLRWLRVVEAAGLFLLIPWAIFVGSLAASPGAGRRWRGLQVGLGLGAAAAAGAAAAVIGLPAFQISDTPGAFYAARLDTVAQFGVVVQLLGTVGVLAGLEACLRTSRGMTRWRIKYAVLGLGGIFLVRFYVLSQVLLFHVVMASYLRTGAATLVLGNLVIALSLVRDRLGRVQLQVSATLLYRSVVVSVLGLYLVAVGALGWVLNQLGVTEDLVWGSLAIFVSAVILAAVLLSEDVRWRMKRFIALNFYRSKYDYRTQWMGFTKRLGALLTLEELVPQLLGAITEAIGTPRGALYLADGRGTGYHLAGTVWVSGLPSTLAPESALLGAFCHERAPLILGNGGSPLSVTSLPVALARAFPEGSVAVPLWGRGILTGVMLLAPERTEAPYTAEDLEFLATVAEQAAGALVTAQLSETVAQAREFEAFHRLTSFVIHDLKNSISALSMLGQNAQANFDDPEFQREALRTLSRTVGRMRALLSKLAAAPEAAPLRFQPVDLAALAAEAALPLKGDARVSLVKALEPVPAVSGDAEAMLHVIQNLIANAVEALEGEGVVTIRTTPESGWVVLSVGDTGCGMSEEFVRKSLFAPFRSTKKGGWGIGLYQARGIVEAHGGRIEVASREGEGTTLWVRLPAATSSSDRMAP